MIVDIFESFWESTHRFLQTQTKMRQLSVVYRLQLDDQWYCSPKLVDGNSGMPGPIYPRTDVLRAGARILQGFDCQMLSARRI